MKLNKNSLKIKKPVLKEAVNRKTRVKRNPAKRSTKQVALPTKSGDKEFDLYKACDKDLFNLEDEVNLADLIVDRPTKTASKKDRYEIITGILDGVHGLKKTVEKKPKVKIKRTPKGQTLMVLFSDWHYGKVIQTTSGRRIFDSEIAHKRIAEDIADAIVDKILLMGKDAKIEDVVIILAGDIVDNDIIYDTQRFSVDSGVAVQFHGVVRAILEMTYKIKGALKKIYKKDLPIVFECITGNHGRAGKSSELAITSWDTAVYSALDLAIQMSDLKNVELNFALEDFRVINVRGHRGLLLHKGPAQAETPSAKKKFGGWYEIFEYDFACYGHLHHWGVATYNGKPLFMNGSLCGYDDFAISLAVRDDWAQLMWTVSDDEPMNQLVRIKG